MLNNHYQKKIKATMSYKDIYDPLQHMLKTHSAVIETLAETWLALGVLWSGKGLGAALFITSLPQVPVNLMNRRSSL
ncbi:hypothetical protein KDW_32170 [Dictyobacter vulcani]|uniref:Uncharacterized protein n=1 Tax=Dictyobacter vulcani TaxID=2607529 RepID=A0A5J4KME8_9CHLR|nr:hypothetical protein KDW_32170 [Dictyobacter vulcani]